MKPKTDPLANAVSLLGAMKIDDFPTLRAARLAGELIMEVRRVEEQRKKEQDNA